MKKFIYIIFAASLMASCTPREKAQDSNEVAEEANEDKFDSKKAEKDAEFVAETVAGNYAEIEMAKLASQKSNNAQVKEVATFLEAEHTKMLGDLQALASTKAISIPTDKTDDARKMIEDMSKEEDVKDFNKDWCKEMKDKHEKTIKKFEDRASETEDADLKALIDSALPNLRTHLDRVKACEESIKDSK